jgi:hypothetical protein
MRPGTGAGEAKVEFADPHAVAAPVEAEVASFAARGDGR